MISGLKTLLLVFKLMFILFVSISVLIIPAILSVVFDSYLFLIALVISIPLSGLVAVVLIEDLKL